ncbi:MAG: Asp23/Gls24 family envelope stress response protein [Clostridia bacterium]|nr:Asp23/Gls24 family envelope stress response protein [Clostridia bacterium]
MENEENKNVEEINVTEDSSIVISDEVVSIIAGVAVSEVKGVVDTAGGFAGGISEVLSGKKKLSKGIKVEVGEKETKIDVNIIVEYGTRIPDIAFEIQNKVKNAVKEMTGLEVVAVNVHVQGVRTSMEQEGKDSKEEN